MALRLSFALLFGLSAWAQTVCHPTPQYTPCDLAFDIPAPPATFDLHAEFRSPKHVPALVNAFHDTGSKWVIRFTPTEGGPHIYPLTSTIPVLNSKEGEFPATAGNKAG